MMINALLRDYILSTPLIERICHSQKYQTLWLKLLVQAPASSAYLQHLFGTCPPSNCTLLTVPATANPPIQQWQWSSRWYGSRSNDGSRSSRQVMQAQPGRANQADHSSSKQRYPQQQQQQQQGPNSHTSPPAAAADVIKEVRVTPGTDSVRGSTSGAGKHQPPTNHERSSGSSSSSSSSSRHPTNRRWPAQQPGHQHRQSSTARTKAAGYKVG